MNTNSLQSMNKMSREPGIHKIATKVIHAIYATGFDWDLLSQTQNDNQFRCQFIIAGITISPSISHLECHFMLLCITIQGTAGFLTKCHSHNEHKFLLVPIQIVMARFYWAIAMSLSLNIEWVLYPFASYANLSPSLGGIRLSDGDSNITIAIAQWKQSIIHIPHFICQ